MKRQPRILTAVAVLAAICFAAPLAARAQVLKQVPADALVVIKTNNLKSISDKLAALTQKWGIAQLNPRMANPMQGFKQSIGANAGLNEAGDAAVAFFNNPVPGPKKEPLVIVLLPVSDYKAFIGNYADAQTEGDFTKVTFPSSHKPGYIANWGSYAALSESKDALSKKPAEGIMPAGLAAKELDSRDIVAYANMKAIREQVLPQLKAHRDQARQEMQKELAKNPNNQQFAGLFNTLFDQGFDTLEQLCQQTSGATMGVTLGDQGITGASLIEFDPNSNWGQSVAKIKNTDEPLITGIPQGKYLFLAGYKNDPQAMTKLIDSIAGPTQQHLAGLGAQGKAVQSLIDAYKTMLGAAESGSFGMLAPAGMLGQESLFQVVGTSRGNAQQLVDGQRQAFDSQQAIMEAMGPNNKMKLQTTYTANAKTVAGVQLNAFSTQVNMQGAQQTPEMMQMQQMMTMMYGPNGMSGVTGIVAPDTAVGASGVSDEMVGKLIAAAKAKDPAAASAQNIQQVAGLLPKQRVLVAFLPLDQWVTTIAGYAKQFGMPINVQLPADLPPIGMGISTEGSAIRADGVLPSQLVQSLIAAGMQTYAQMQQGQRPPAGAEPQ
jgi:hypothetical protein